jgi:hypothetical protein
MSHAQWMSCDVRPNRMVDHKEYAPREPDQLERHSPNFFFTFRCAMPFPSFSWRSPLCILATRIGPFPDIFPCDTVGELVNGFYGYSLVGHMSNPLDIRAHAQNPGNKKFSGQLSTDPSPIFVFASRRSNLTRAERRVQARARTRRSAFIC